MRRYRWLGVLVVAAAACPAQEGASGVGSPVGALVAQLLVGRAGFEPGVAVELASAGMELRPELFLSEDGRPGGGAALLWDLPAPVRPGQRLGLGPRLVHHDADEHGWEIGGMAIWSLPFAEGHPRRHALELIGTVGLIDEGSRVGVGFGLGLAYAFGP